MRVRGPFSRAWLAARLAELLPDYPAVSLCVAVSGGMDSTVLLAALAGSHRGARPKLRAVHVDHGLHANSPIWSAQCRALADSLGVPLEVLTANISRARGDSLEAVARESRYALLAANLSQGEFLLTAHHEDDQLETVLLQLFRGGGPAGIAAMPPLTRFARGWLARPLLTRTRSDLHAWAKANKLSWSEDDTNEDETLSRNYLRRRILPLIRERWPGVATAVARSARHAAEAQRLLDILARRDVERAADGDRLAVSALRALPPDRRRNALRFWITQSGHRPPDASRLAEICGPLLEAREDANPRVVWNGALAQRDGGWLAIGPEGAPGTEAAQPVLWHWRSQRDCRLSDGRGKLELRHDPRGPLDLDALPEPLMVRTRSGGERLRPRRGGPRRALKNLLQEAHVSITERKRLPLLWSGDRLVAAADLWCDESVQAGPDTQHRGRLRWRR